MDAFDVSATRGLEPSIERVAGLFRQNLVRRTKQPIHLAVFDERINRPLHENAVPHGPHVDAAMNHFGSFRGPSDADAIHLAHIATRDAIKAAVSPRTRPGGGDIHVLQYGPGARDVDDFVTALDS